MYGPACLPGYGSFILTSSCSHVVASALLDTASPKDKCLLILHTISNKKFCSPNLPAQITATVTFHKNVQNVYGERKDTTL